MSYQQQPLYQPPQPPRPTAKRKVWPWVLAVIGAFLLGAVIGTAADTKPGSSSARETVTVRVPAPDGAPASAAAPQPAGPAATMDSGTYQVGVDVQPGQYKTAGPEGADSLGCYWARLKDDSGSFEAIIANANLAGPGSVTVNQGEFVQLNGDCTWTKVG